MRYSLKVFQDTINDNFLKNLVFFLRISPKKADEHFETCLSLSYNKYRHYPNHWARRKGLSMVCKTNIWGYFE